jgi:ribose transport system ATP-binding protein
MTDAILELLGISKSYPGVRALSNVHFTAKPGEVVGLIGENGAGKSTLMKILGGVTEPTSGTIRIGGVERAHLTVSEAIASGIAFVHQELNLFDNLDVASNVYFGRELFRRGPLRLVDNASLESRTRNLLARLGADFRPGALVADLSLAQRQLVEIAKAISLDARVVIMDEPTSSLTVAETDRLLDVVAALKSNGVCVIFITHRLNEIERCADRVVALRDGAVVGELHRGEIARTRMIRLMIGRDLKSLYTPPAAPAGPEALVLRDLQTPARPGRSISLALRQGEIVGLAGLVGSGRTELVRTIFGIDRPLSGTITCDGAEVDIRSPRDAIDRGIYLVPEDRKGAGLILAFDIACNVSLANLEAYANAYILDGEQERDVAKAQVRSLNIRAPNVAVLTSTLSGGNQQKVVLAKWLSMKPKVMLFDEPTRGIDVGAKKEIYDMMRQLADEGVAILMVSSDMEEVIGVSDRILVMHEGAISGALAREEFSESNVLRLAVGDASTREAAC